MGTYLVAIKAEAKGGKGGNQWDDGYDFQDVTKIRVRGGLEGIKFIKFEYVKAGKTVAGPIHGVSGPGFTQTFEIKNSEKEFLLSVEGYYNESTGVMQSIQFITNKKTSDVMGYEEGTKFSLRASRSKIIGFHGFAEKNLNSLGAYFLRMPSIKSGIEGGQTTGKGYDDGGDYDGIRKVYVTSDGSAIRHVRFDYVNTGQVETRERGVKIGTQEEFEVNHPNEYITSVEGTYAVTQPYGCIVLTSLTFKTSNGRASPIIGKVTGTKFVLQNNGNAIVGFHGRVGSCVDGIGAYYFPLPPPPQGEGSDGANFIQTPAIKSVIEGGQTTGKNYDDGGDYDGIRKVFVTSDGAAIRYVRFDYDKAGQVDTRERGEKVGTQHEFTVEHPNEYITSVEGTYAVTQPYGCIVLTSLTFKTSKGKTSPAIGKVTGTKFKLESQGDAIVGFHGRVGSCVDGIGAYYAAFPRSPPKPAPAPAPAPNPAPDPAPAPAPAPAPTPAPPVDTDSSPQKVEAQGGKGGNKWDDGADHDGVTKIHVIYGVAVEQIRFDYVKNGHPKEGTFHGIKGNRSFTYTLEVNHPDEYILSVNGCYDSSNIIQGIEFKTNTQTFNYIGSDEGTQFSLEVKDKKIIGFHGFADTHLNSLGAYFTPTTN